MLGRVPNDMLRLVPKKCIFVDAEKWRNKKLQKAHIVSVTKGAHALLIIPGPGISLPVLLKRH